MTTWFVVGSTWTSQVLPRRPTHTASPEAKMVLYSASSPTWFSGSPTAMSATTSYPCCCAYFFSNFETSVPRPDAMVIQPRTLRSLLSLAHTAKPPGPKNELVFGGSVSVASNE